MTAQPDWVLWLADAPMFIDESQVERYYDAVVRPESKEGTTTIQFSEETAKKIQGAIKGKVGFDTGDLLSYLFAWMPSFSAEGAVEGSGERATKSASSNTVVLHPISNPTRQLVQMALYYLANVPNRVFYADGVAGKDWYDPQKIADVPRALLALNLPGRKEADDKRLPHTKLIPVAAEFTNGTVVTYFPQFKPEPGKPAAPKHPDVRDSNYDNYVKMKKAYWRWYAENFEIQPSIELIEKSVQEQGCRIQWIDFRVPLTDDGETLHLHVVGNGKYDTITYAYNFIRRGYEFGLRLIGLLKADPDLNVLAIYER